MLRGWRRSGSLSGGFGHRSLSEGSGARGLGSAMVLVLLASWMLVIGDFELGALGLAFWVYALR